MSGELRKTFTTKTPYGGKTKRKKIKKKFPLSAATKGVTATVGKAYKRVPASGAVTAHERGLVKKRTTSKGAGKPLNKGRSRLKKNQRS